MYTVCTTPTLTHIRAWYMHSYIQMICGLNFSAGSGMRMCSHPVMGWWLMYNWCSELPIRSSIEADITHGRGHMGGDWANYTVCSWGMASEKAWWMFSPTLPPRHMVLYISEPQFQCSAEHYLYVYRYVILCVLACSQVWACCSTYICIIICMQY